MLLLVARESGSGLSDGVIAMDAGEKMYKTAVQEQGRRKDG